MGLLERNGHVLYRRFGPGDPLPCWKEVWRAGIRRDIEQAGGDPEEYTPLLRVHDATCVVCRGGGTYIPQIVVAYECLGCLTAHPKAIDFDDTSCLAIGPIMEEMKYQHEQGFHTELGHNVPDCPGCAAIRIERKKGGLATSANP